MSRSISSSTTRRSYPLSRSLRRNSVDAWSRRANASSAATRAARASSGSTSRRPGISGLFGVATAIHGRLLRNQFGADLVLHILGDFRMLLQEGAGIVLALSDALALVAVPGTGLLHEIVQHAQLDDLAFPRDTGAIHDLELGLPKRRSHFVLDDLDASHRAHDFLAILDGADAPNVHAHRGVELERIAAGCRLRVAEHDADLHADLIDENHDGVGALDVAGELAQRLRHEPSLQTHVLVAHFTFDFGLGRERRDRIDHDHVHRARTHQHVGDFERLFSRVGVRYQKIVDLDAELFRVHRVERV